MFFRRFDYSDSAHTLMKHFTITVMNGGLSDLFGDGFAVQFVVDLPDLCHSESGDGQRVQTEGHLLLWDQRHRRGRGDLRLRVFTCDRKTDKNRIKKSEERG